MIYNVIFDLGNVLLSYKPDEYLAKHVDDPIAARDMHEIIFLGAEWVALDEGKLTMREAIEIFTAKAPKYATEIRRVMKNWHDMLTPIEPAIATLKELRKVVSGLYYLSNYHEEAAAYVTRKYDFFKLFDGGVFSFEVKMKKPNPAIYKVLLERYSLKASECVFIDDMEENVRAAESLGIKGLLETATGLSPDTMRSARLSRDTMRSAMP